MQRLTSKQQRRKERGEDVVILLDTNPTMHEEFDAHNNNDFLGTTKFDVARYIVQQLVTDFSSSNASTVVVAVILLKTAKTSHHFYRDDDTDDNTNENSSSAKPFPNIIEITAGGDEDLPKKLEDFVVTSSSRKNPSHHQDPSVMKGDFLNGIIVGADSLFRKTITSNDIYTRRRRIILLTDAQHKVDVDQQQLLVTMDSLRTMNCHLEVVGFGFEQEVDYTEQSGPSGTNVRGDINDIKSDDEEKDGEESDDNGEEDEEDIICIRSQNEVFLIHLTSKLGGIVVRASGNMQDILDKLVRRSTQTATEIGGTNCDEMEIEKKTLSSPPSNSSPMFKLCLDARQRGRKIIQIAVIASTEDLYRRASEEFGCKIDTIRYDFPPKIISSSSRTLLSSILSDNLKLQVELDRPCSHHHQQHRQQPMEGEKESNEKGVIDLSVSPSIDGLHTNGHWQPNPWTLPKRIVSSTESWSSNTMEWYRRRESRRMAP